MQIVSPTRGLYLEYINNSYFLTVVKINNPDLFRAKDISLSNIYKQPINTQKKQRALLGTCQAAPAEQCPMTPQVHLWRHPAEAKHGPENRLGFHH